MERHHAMGDGHDGSMVQDGGHGCHLCGSNVKVWVHAVLWGEKQVGSKLTTTLRYVRKELLKCSRR